MILSRCRLLPDATADGPHNMAADEVLLESAANGVASLRFYGWSAATLSLGYFQADALRQSNPLTAALPFVRRPSGGAALIHHHELTYALALPEGGSCWLCRMHHIIEAGLRDLGVATEACQVERPPLGKLLCFQHHTPGDLILGSAKVVGSAQRRHRAAMMQHGGILLAASPFTPELPGILELSGRSLTTDALRSAVLRQFALQIGGELEADTWTDAERRRIGELVESKYTRDSWNRKR